MLTGITITGVDDDCDIATLAGLCARYSFLEWGVLYSTKRAGKPRYPSPAWLERLARVPFRRALHLCGMNALSFVDAPLSTFRAVPGHDEFDRIQVNGNLPPFFMPEVVPNTPIIWQIAREAELMDGVAGAREYRIRGGRGELLFDGSGGKGVEPFRWPVHPCSDVPMGLAGGIGPHNVVDVISDLGPRSQPFWLDMESKVRTSDRLDFDLVREVLEAAAPYVCKP